MTEYRGTECPLTDWAGQRRKLITLFILGALPLFALFGYMFMIGVPGA
jgi:hypothetical protein